MEFRKLGKLDVSAIGLGTLRTFDVTDDDEIAVRRQIVDNCLDSDVNLIDTASWYGHAEQVLGEIAWDVRDRFYIATKVRTEGKEAGEAQIARSLRAAEDRLHRPPPSPQHDRLADSSPHPGAAQGRGKNRYGGRVRHGARRLSLPSWT